MITQTEKIAEKSASTPHQMRLIPANVANARAPQAHCKAPYDAKVRQALLATLTLCREAGIEWQDIEHQIVYPTQ